VGTVAVRTFLGRRGAAGVALSFAVSLAACGTGTPAQVGDVDPGTDPPTAGTASLPVRDPIDLESLVRIVDHLEGTLVGFATAWTAHDSEGVLSSFGDHTIHEDTGFGLLITGADLDAFGEFEESDHTVWSMNEVFVADGVALDVSEAWDLDLSGHRFTADDPLYEIDRTEVLPDGTIGRWTLFYSLETYAAWHAPESRIAAARDVVDGYRRAWQSRDASRVEALYTDDAVRVDSLFGRVAAGSDEIGAEASVLFDRSRGTSFVPGVVFADNRRSLLSPERVGATMDVAVESLDGETCTVRMAVILTVLDGLITHEEVFWNADSLIACGWAA